MAETDDLGVLARDAALAAGGGRELIVATGADRLRFLNGIVTGDVAGAAVGAGCRSALLTPKGHVVADMWLLVAADAVRIVVEAGQGEGTAAALSRYAIMDDFTAARQPDFALLSVLGPAAAARLQAVGLAAAGELAGRPPLSHAEAAGPAGPLWLARVRELGADGFWLGGGVAAVTAAMSALEDAGVPKLTLAAVEAARVAAVEPRWGREITADYFPMEVGLSAAIAYGKGCFLGQEPIVRIRDRGRTNWRLCGLDVTNGAGAGELPASQDPLQSDVKPRAGRVTSAARLPDGRVVAMAMVHNSVPVGAEVRIEHAGALLPATVREEAA